MDLGATICTPKRPSCLMCPIAGDCAAHKRGIAALLPMRAARPERPVRLGLAFVALREDGSVLLRRRPEAGLLGGMLEVPSTEWGETLPPVKEALRGSARARRLVGRARRRGAHLHAFPPGGAGLSRHRARRCRA